MEVAADKRNLDDTLINVSIITITTSNHKDFESALYELVKFPIVLNWTNSEEGFSTTVIHFPKRLNQSEERKLVSFLKVLRRKVKFEWNIEVAKIPQDDDFWIYSDLLNYIKGNYREYYEVQNICEFNEPTAVRITKLVLQITEKKQIGETTVYRRKWSIYEAEVAAGHRPIFIIAPAMSKVESGWHYLKRVDDHEIFRKPPDLDHTGVLEIAQRVGINLNKLDKPVWATLVELHSKHPIFFELTYPVPLKEVFKLRDVKEVINDAITSGGILDSVVQFITPAFLISALPEFVSPSVMRYNPHGFIITNTKIGKSSIAEKLGQRIERPTIAGLIGFSDAKASTNFSKNEMDIMDEMDIGVGNAMDDEVRGMDTSGEGSTSISSISSIRNSNQGSAPSKSKNIGDRQSFSGGYVSTDISIESSKVDNLPENIRIQGLIEIWQECLASSSSKHNAVTTFWELAKSQYRSEDLCRADILNHFEEIGLPQWFKRELGVKTTLQDVLGKKLGWG